jgi:hypothetical protein
MKLSRFALAALTLALGAPAFLTAQYPPPQDHPDQGHGGWDAPPQEFRDVQRQAFHEGIEAARKDINYRRPANAEMHEEFRHPSVEPGLRDDYRDAFRRGYNLAFTHSQEILGGQPMAQPGPPPDHDRGPWDAPPQEFRDVQRQGFHDGIEAARRDIAEQHPIDVERKREFREPPVPPESREEYREGFHRGYDMALTHFRDEHEHHGDVQDQH